MYVCMYVYIYIYNSAYYFSEERKADIAADTEHRPMR